MKTRRFRIVAALAIVPSIALVLVWLSTPRSITQAHFELLRPGMTKAEVESMLHGPPRDDVPYSAIIWVPDADGTRRSAAIAPGSPGAGFYVSERFRDRPRNEVAPKDGSALTYFPLKAAEHSRQAVWIGEKGLIAVLFGHDGRLKQKYFSNVYVTRPPAVFEWLDLRPRTIRNRLGI